MYFLRASELLVGAAGSSTPHLTTLSIPDIEHESDLSDEEFDLYLLLHSLFLNSEYLRIYNHPYFFLNEHSKINQHAMQKTILNTSIHPKVMFIRFYAKYLSIEQSIQRHEPKLIGTSFTFSNSLNIPQKSSFIMYRQ